MKEMIRNGFDNLGQKSEPFSADHHRPRVGLELRRWQHLRFFEPSFGFGRKWRHRKKIRDRYSNGFSILTFLSSFRPIQRRLKFDDLAILKLRHQNFCIFADVELRSGDLSHHN